MTKIASFQELGEPNEELSPSSYEALVMSAVGCPSSLPTSVLLTPLPPQIGPPSPQAGVTNVLAASRISINQLLFPTLKLPGTSRVLLVVVVKYVGLLNVWALIHQSPLHGSNVKSSFLAPALLDASNSQTVMIVPARKSLQAALLENVTIPCSTAPLPYQRSVPLVAVFKASAHRNFQPRTSR